MYNSILILALGLLSHSTSPGNKPSPSGGVWSEAQTVKNPPAMQETQVRSLGREDPLEEGMATHSSILAWRIPWTEEPGGPQSVGSHRVRQAETDRQTDRHTHSIVWGSLGCRVRLWSQDPLVRRGPASPAGSCAVTVRRRVCRGGVGGGSRRRPSRTHAPQPLGGRFCS